VLAKAPDGEAVPVSLLYRKTTSLDGTPPMLVCGYGSYGISYRPHSFRTGSRWSTAALCSRIAHVRGGTEKRLALVPEGNACRQAKHVFRFIAATEHLGTRKFAALTKWWPRAAQQAAADRGLANHGLTSTGR